MATTLNASDTTLAVNLLLLDTASKVQSALAAAGVESCVIKGCALLATVYSEDPELRPMDDVDVVVAPGNSRLAALVLERELGLVYRRGSGREFVAPPGAPGEGILRVDLHDRLHHGGRPAVTAMLRRSREAQAGRVPLRIPSPCDLMLEVVAHALLHQCSFKGNQLQDVARLAAACDPFELRRFTDRARMVVPMHVALSEAMHASGAAAEDTTALARCAWALSELSWHEQAAAHLMRRRAAKHEAPGRTHLALALLHGDPPAAAAHIVRRWIGGAEHAILAESGRGSASF